MDTAANKEKRVETKITERYESNIYIGNLLAHEERARLNKKGVKSLNLHEIFSILRWWFT